MKRIIMFSTILLSCIILSPTKVVAQKHKGQFQYAISINGYWGDWKSSYIGVGIEKFYFNGTINNFVIHSSEEHPSNYVMKVTINDYRLDTDKKSRKQRLKDNVYYEYEGTVEYYTELTFQDFGEYTHRWPYISWNTSKGKKHVAKAIIKIQPYKEYPQILNIFFENYGVAISVPNNK